MAGKFKIRKGDKIVVTSGKDKGKTGEVIRVMPSDQKVLVQGVNISQRHQRQTQTVQGGIVAKEMPIHISNVAHADPKEGTATKVGMRTLEDGRKVRFAKKSGEVIDV